MTWQKARLYAACADDLEAVIGTTRPDGETDVWLVARKRDTEPWEVSAFDRYDQAALFFDAAAAQWSTVYFCRVAHYEGRPLDVTPIVSAFAAQLAAAEAKAAEIKKKFDEYRRDGQQELFHLEGAVETLKQRAEAAEAQLAAIARMGDHL